MNTDSFGRHIQLTFISTWLQLYFYNY